MDFLVIDMSYLEEDRRALAESLESLTTALRLRELADPALIFRLRHLQGRLGSHVRAERYQDRLAGMLTAFALVSGEDGALNDSFTLTNGFFNFDSFHLRPSRITCQGHSASSPFIFLPDLLALATLQLPDANCEAKARAIVGRTHTGEDWKRAGALVTKLARAVLDGTRRTDLVKLFTAEVEKDEILRRAVRESLETSPTCFLTSADAGALIRTLEWTINSRQEWNSLRRELNRQNADEFLGALAAAVAVGQKGIKYLLKWPEVKNADHSEIWVCLSRIYDRSGR